MNMKFHVQRDFGWGRFQLFGMKKVLGPEGLQLVTKMQPVMFEVIPRESEGQDIPPAMLLDDADAQSLTDALWEAGVRPTNGAGSVGQLAATEAHLKDMQAIVRHALKMTVSQK